MTENRPEFMQKRITELRQGEFLPRMVEHLRRAYVAGDYGTWKQVGPAKSHEMEEICDLERVYSTKFGTSLFDEIINNQRDAQMN